MRQQNTAKFRSVHIIFYIISLLVSVCTDIDLCETSNTCGNGLLRHSLPTILCVCRIAYDAVPLFLCHTGEMQLRNELRIGECAEFASH